MASHADLARRPGWLIAVVVLAACSTSSGTDDTTFDCRVPPADLATCVVDMDCTMVAGGCYCGAQPLDGVAVAHANAAQGCETEAASSCALGCANEPGFRAQDGKHADASAMIQVRCETATGTCKTYVP